MRGSEMERAASRRPAGGGRGAARPGPREAEADAAITLGLGMAYLDEPEAGLESLRAGVALALELDIPLTAVRGYVNLSDVVELLGRHEEAASDGRGGPGAGRAGRAGPHPRLLPDRQPGRAAAAPGRVGARGRAARALHERACRRACSPPPCTTCGPSSRSCAAGTTTPSRDLREGRRVMGDTDDAQFTQPYRYLDAMIALSRGDLGAARDAAGRRRWTARIADWQARYAWPVLWTAMRVEAEEAIRARDRRQDVPPEIAERLRQAGRHRGADGDPGATLARVPGAGRRRAGQGGRRRPGTRPGPPRSPPGGRRASRTRWPTRCCGWPRRTRARRTGRR